MKELVTATLSIVLTVSWAFTALADEPKKKVEDEPKLCESTEEYVKTLRFLREVDEVFVREGSSRDVATQVAAGCDGSSARFAKTLLLMKKMGVDHGRAIQIAVEFARESDDTQQSFSDIFQRIYLTEFFDFDFIAAYKVAYELSKDYKGNRDLVREDFLDLAKFCITDKHLGLPRAVCAQYAIDLARMSQYYPKGISEPFKSIYKVLREKEPFGLPVREALTTSMEVLKYGPKAPDNFLKAYRFALDKQGHDDTAKDALVFGLAMARRSITDLPPPLANSPKKEDGK